MDFFILITIGVFVSLSNNCIDAGTYQFDTSTITWTNNVDSTNFKMTRVNANIQNYIAFAFSKDTSMGDDDVAICALYPDGTVNLLHHYNEGKSSYLMSASDPQLGFTNVKTIYSNGVLECSFTRAKSMSSVGNYFNLNIDYHLLVANGIVANTGSILRHSTKTASPNTINFSY